MRILKKRANRGGCGIVKLDGEWYVASGNGALWVGYLDGPFSKREAIQMSARFAMPKGNNLKITVS